MPSWFLWVSKWFMHGLNRPFGSVSQIPSIFLPHPVVQKDLSCVELYEVYNLYPNNDSISFTQNDAWNCRVCCQILFLTWLSVNIKYQGIAKRIQMGVYQKASKLAQAYYKKILSKVC